MNHEVTGTSACHCCGAWNSILHYDDSEDEWACSNGCQDLPDHKYTVKVGGSGAPVAYRDPEGNIMAKNANHACYIWQAYMS